MGQRGSHSDSLNLAVAQRRRTRSLTVTARRGSGRRRRRTRSLTVTASMSRPLHVKGKNRAVRGLSVLASCPSVAVAKNGFGPGRRACCFLGGVPRAPGFHSHSG